MGFAAICVLLAIAAFWLILPFWQAIAWGVALAVLVHPIHNRLNARFSDAVSAGITTALTLLFIVLPLAAIGLAIYGEANHVREQLSSSAGTGDAQFSINTAITEVENFVQPKLDAMGINMQVNLRESVERLVSSAVGNAPQIARSVVFGLLTFVFALLLVFFILRDGHRLRVPAEDLIPLPKERSGEIIRTIYDTIHATFYGIVLVALMQGTVLGITFWALGLPAPLLWGMACVVLCTIPFAGAPIIWVPAALLLAAQGEWIRAIVLVAVGVLVIGLIDNIFRPVIIGARVNLHPIAVFFAIFGGIVTLGAVGILVGPVLLSVSLGAIQVLREIATQPEEAA